MGLPVAAYAVAAGLYGRNAGLVAGLVAIWLTAVIRKVMTGSVPSLLTISGGGAHAGDRGGARHRRTLALPAAVPAGQLVHVHRVRPHGGPPPNPLVARLAAEVVALRQPAIHCPGLHRFFQGATWLVGGYIPCSSRRPWRS